MNTRVLDFSSFGEALWRIADVFRDDTLKTTEYLEEFSYFFFLKLWDEQEQAAEAEMEALEEVYIPYLPPEMRFYTWASNPDAAAKARGFESVVAYVNDLFDRLSHIGNVVEIKNKQRTYFPPGYTLIQPGFVRLKPEIPLDRALREGTFDYDEVIRIERNLDLFRRLFQNHTLRVRYDPTIRELCKRLLVVQIQAETGGKWDKLGRAYEYVVNKLGEQKQYGQYFTPRHIVDRIVQVVSPEPDEWIYDPAAGTGGFLVRAFEHVQDKINKRVTDSVRREQMLRKLKEDHLWGVEKAPDVFKLGLMNMILHGDGSTHLDEADSLSNQAQDEHKSRYDVIIANPPFGPTAQERLGSFEYNIKLYEALFTQHIYNALKPGGRAAFVIKEGLLFDGKNVLQRIRRRLIERFHVLGVISLPNGIFNPYSGAKTSVLVIRRPASKNDPHPTGYVWFYSVESDGRDLGATRRPLADYDSDGDLADMVARFPYTFQNGYPALKSGQDVTTHGGKWWWVSLDKIRDQQYNLTAGRYNPNPPPTVDHEDPRELINRLLDLEAEIRQDLEELLEMISVPQSATLLKGAFPTLRLELEEERDAG
ncbi:MAG: N-6 DNA methylase [Chloroflexi bacterium]|nr:N-6 DNA methylase [Chloroflexota bacterium]